MLERDIEAKCRRYAKANGSYFRKFVSPSNRSVPDDILITPLNRRALTWFAEFKAPGNDLTELQFQEHVDIKLAGGVVYTFDSFEDFKEVYDIIHYNGIIPDSDVGIFRRAPTR